MNWYNCNVQCNESDDVCYDEIEMSIGGEYALKEDDSALCRENYKTKWSKNISNLCNGHIEALEKAIESVDIVGKEEIALIYGLKERFRRFDKTLLRQSKITDFTIPVNK